LAGGEAAQQPRGDRRNACSFLETPWVELPAGNWKRPPCRSKKWPLAPLPAIFNFQKVGYIVDQKTKELLTELEIE
jgi:hypothetical protein